MLRKGMHANLCGFSIDLETTRISLPGCSLAPVIIIIMLIQTNVYIKW